jgi:hypothetical protein
VRSAHHTFLWGVWQYATRVSISCATDIFIETAARGRVGRTLTMLLSECETSINAAKTLVSGGALR